MMDYRRFKSQLLVVVSFLVVAFTGCEKKGPNEQIFTGTALGTTYQLKFFHPEELNLAAGLDSIFGVINNSMSTYQEDSDISKINLGSTGIKVDENFKEVFRYSEKIYKESDGYFDPTVGNLVNAYGFGPDKNLDSLSSSEIDSILQYVGFNKLELTLDNTIEKQLPGVYIDFNAIAKGYTVDVIARYLNSRNVEDYLIELGGELVAKGINQGRQQPWVVAIDNPLQTEGNRTLQATLNLKNRAMATSGNYRKFRIDSVTGERFVHTINPLSGKPEKSNLLSVSVLAENCALADGYATAFMAMGFEKSKEMLNNLEDVDVYFIYTEADEDVNVYTSQGFKDALNFD
ncbi:FAD:protein FMN transferase [Gillisia limnaea]|uniref:FAD:protein FMN transferase n=1 Tax=Gillisia limnaea (strain DSM 15749 / LMG 21470 / R-8282) TaxID=865937 RepID=H2BX23_GILLR|nr:FAD:protein FMN transferase [Gillisia limnaea]EHQ01975.1 ApbE family lipoprotein [Gillisia limnaea DSM 15749]